MTIEERAALEWLAKLARETPDECFPEPHCYARTLKAMLDRYAVLMTETRNNS